MLYGLLGWAGWRLTHRFEDRLGPILVLVLYLAAMAMLFLVATLVYTVIEPRLPRRSLLIFRRSTENGKGPSRGSRRTVRSLRHRAERGSLTPINASERSRLVGSPTWLVRREVVMQLSNFVLAGLIVAASGVAVLAAEAPEVLRREGAFNFPQPQAQVLCDEPELRVSTWNDNSHLYVQAILWSDGDDALGESADGRPIGDWAVLCLDVDADGKATPQKDRDYTLNPWPSLPGLCYQVRLSEHSTTTLQRDSKGRGAIRYIDGGEGKRVRVDSFVIPLSEIGRRAGETIRLAYCGDSPHPEMTVNSVGYRRQGRYYSHQLPRDSYRAITLADRPPTLDLDRVPDGKNDPCPLPTKPTRPTPAVGTIPPTSGRRTGSAATGLPGSKTCAARWSWSSSGRRGTARASRTSPT